MRDNTITTQQLNNLIEFRQGFYQHLTKAGDAQFELIDALLTSPRVNSFAEITLSPLFRRGWASAYAAIEDGQQDPAAIRKLFCAQLPQNEVVVCPLDTTVWPHPSARTLDELVYAVSPTKAARRQTAVVGHIYSLLAWAPERGSSWGLPLVNECVPLARTAIEMGVAQVEQVLATRQEQGATGLLVVPADGSYGTHKFLAPLRTEPNLATVVRLRRDRVLYGPPPDYSGSGRPRKHGHRFAFKEPDTWLEPDQSASFNDRRWGSVRLRGWHNLHPRQDADTPFTVIYVEVHLEREQRPIWIAYQGPREYRIRQAWLWFDHRWPIEPSNRFRKRDLHWVLPNFQQNERCARWTTLVDAANWQVFLARHLVRDQPLPWQKSLPQLTPGRVLAALGPIFSQVDTPVKSVQSRGKSPGWPPGKPRKRPVRYKPCKRSRKKRPEPA